jgi:hypothetical protein
VVSAEANCYVQEDKLLIARFKAGEEEAFDG